MGSKVSFAYAIMATAILFASCSQDQSINNDNDKNAPVILCLTSDASSITQTSAVLSGSASIKNAKANNANAYFYYSTASGDAKTIKASGQRVSAGNIPNSGGDFSYNLNFLSPSTTYYYVASVGIDDVEELGSVKSFATEKKTDALSVTGAAINVTVNSATLTSYANLAADMTGDVTIGIIYSTNPAPSLQNGRLLTSKDLDGNNMYQVEVTDLTPDTKYYFKSFLSRSNLNYYGDVKEFSTAQVLASVSTLDAWEVAETQASVGGKVEVSSAGVVKREAAIYYGVDGSNIEALKIKGKKVGIERISDEGAFTTTISGLDAETKYYYVAVVLVEGVEFCGTIKNFTTANKPVPVAITGDYSDLGESSVKLYGWCNQEGAEGVSVVYGIEYSDIDLTTSAVSLKANEKDAENKFSCQATGLSSNTLYYYRAYVIFNGVRLFGEVKTFTTKTFSAQTTSLAATNITEFKATLNGELKVESVDELSKDVWFLYSETANDLESLKTSGIIVTSSLQEDGSFMCSIPQQKDYLFDTNLNYNTTYYYVACSRVHDKDYYGEVKSFTTKDIIASTTTSGVSNIGFNKATLSGFLSVENTIGFDKTVGFWYGNGTTAEQIKSFGTKVFAKLENDGSFSCQVTPLSPNSTYHYVAFAIIRDKEFFGEVKTFTTDNIPQGAIDLGLSVAWASCNIGASSPEEYGDSYAWGEIETKSNYGWSTYKFNEGAYDDPGGFTKYCSDPSWGEVDNRFFLEPEDDVAHIKLGGKWRIPTFSEWRELMDMCSWKWDTLNGINGLTFTSKINGNSIFLPAAGRKEGTQKIKQGENTAYWSSVSWTDTPFAFYYKYTGYGVSESFCDKCLGLSVRAVLDQ